MAAPPQLPPPNCRHYRGGRYTIAATAAAFIVVAAAGIAAATDARNRAICSVAFLCLSSLVAYPPEPHHQLGSYFPWSSSTCCSSLSHTHSLSSSPSRFLTLRRVAYSLGPLALFSSAPQFFTVLSPSLVQYHVIFPTLFSTVRAPSTLFSYRRGSWLAC